MIPKFAIEFKQHNIYEESKKGRLSLWDSTAKRARLRIFSPSVALLLIRDGALNRGSTDKKWRYGGTKEEGHGHKTRDI